jgi:hypothetical protein
MRIFVHPCRVHCLALQGPHSAGRPALFEDCHARVTSTHLLLWTRKAGRVSVQALAESVCSFPIVESVIPPKAIERGPTEP